MFARYVSTRTSSRLHNLSKHEHPNERRLPPPQGAALAYTPFCDNNKEMDEFRRGPGGWGSRILHAEGDGAGVLGPRAACQHAKARGLGPQPHAV